MTQTSSATQATARDPFAVSDIGDMDFLLSASRSTTQTEAQRLAERQDEADEANALHAKVKQIFS